MSMTVYDGMRHARREFGTLLMRQIATSDELFSLMPFVAKNAEGWSYLREKSTGAFNFIAPGANVANSTATTERVVVPTREATEDFWIDTFVRTTQNGEGGDPMDFQSMQKAKAAGRAIAGKVINGTGVDTMTLDGAVTSSYLTALVSASPYIDDRGDGGTIKYAHTGTLLQFRAPGDREFGAAVTASADGDYTLVSESPSKTITVTVDVSALAADALSRVTFSASGNDFTGLVGQVSSGQTRPAGANGDALSFEIMEELMDSVKYMTNPVFIGHSRLRRKFNSLMRALGGTQPSFVLESGRSVPTFNDVPFLKNDYIVTNGTKGTGTNLTSLFLVDLAEETGFYMGAGTGSTLNVEGDPRDTNVMGFQFTDLGPHQTKSQVGRRLSWFGSPALGSDLSAAVAVDIESV